MRVFRNFVLVAILLVLGLGCVSGVTVKTNGFLSQQVDRPQLTPSSRIYVRSNPQAENLLFDQEVARKVKRLLQNQGYVVVMDTNAPYVLEYVYAMDEGKVVTETLPEYHPGDIVHHSGRYRINGQEGTYAEYSSSAGYIAHVPVDKIIYTRKLTIKVRSNNENNSDPLWIGESYSQGTAEDFREMIDYLLVGTFRSFAKDTHKFSRMVIPFNDPEVLFLRGQ